MEFLVAAPGGLPAGFTVALAPEESAECGEFSEEGVDRLAGDADFRANPFLAL